MKTDDILLYKKDITLAHAELQFTRASAELKREMNLLYSRHESSIAMEDFESIHESIQIMDEIFIQVINNLIFHYDPKEALTEFTVRIGDES